jgi:hypothetical protein
MQDRRYAARMRTVRAHVRSGRIVVDEPTDLPDGNEVEVHLDDSGALRREEIADIEAGIDAGLADAEAGRVRDARAVLAELRART